MISNLVDLNFPLFKDFVSTSGLIKENTNQPSLNHFNLQHTAVSAKVVQKKCISVHDNAER